MRYGPAEAFAAGLCDYSKISCIGSYIVQRKEKTSSPMGNDRSPESQHNVGDTIIYDDQRQTVFNLENFN